MGRESLVACMPTSPSRGESAAPMENSPPGIQTIPAGAGWGAGAELGTVGAKLTVAVVVESVELAGALAELAAVDSAGFREQDRQIRKIARSGATVNPRNIRALGNF